MKIRMILFLTAIFTLNGVAPAQDKEPASRWANFENGRVHYYDIGDRTNKNALVFIHGWTGNADLWRDSYTAFPNYRVIALDLIGHGKSDKPRVDYTMEYFAKSVEAVLKKAKVQRAVLVGHSMGMPVARQFYRNHSGKTLGIVNVDGSIRAFPDKQQYNGILASFRSDYRKTSTQFIDSMVAAMKDEKLKQRIRSANQMTPDHVGISAMSAFGDDDLWKTDPIQVPVLAIFAESPWWPADTESFMRSIAPKLEYHLWKGPTHFLMMEKPGEFNNSMRAFIVSNKLL